MKINNLTKYYDDNLILDNVSLDIENGKITCLLGMSGSGKTTLLKCISSLEDYSGDIDDIHKISYIFQDDRLIDNISVLENLKLVSINENKIDDILSFFSILDKKNSLVKKLSGGEKKKVGIARAFLYDSDIILADEALTMLDDINRYRILDYVIDLYKKSNKTILWVTHSIQEALYIADRIYILANKKIGLKIDLDESKNRNIEDVIEYYNKINQFFNQI